MSDVDGPKRARFKTSAYRRALSRLAERHRDEFEALYEEERGPRLINVPAKCGTRSGATAHRRRGEDVCTDCRLAENAAQKKARDAKAASRRARPATS